MNRLIDWIKKLFEKKLIRYLFTGGILFVIDTAVFLVLKNLMGIEIYIAQWISRAVGATIGFVGHKFFVFKDDDVRYLTLTWQGVLYIGLVVVNVFLSGWLIFWLNRLMELRSDIILKVINEVIMVTETYIILNLIFKKRNSNGQKETEESAEDHNPKI